MNPFTSAVVKCVAAVFSPPDPVVEIGALQYKDKENVRAHFPSRPYIGCDLEKGDGVDRIEDVTRLTFKDGEVGTIIALHLLEHVYDIFAAFSEITRVVKPGGAAIIVCPFAVHLHRYPKDYWRFTDDSMRMLMKGFPWAIIGRRGHDSFPRDVFAIGFKNGAFPDFDRLCESFRQMLVKEGREEQPLLERIRCRLACAIAKKKYFQGFFDWNDVTLDFVKPS